jgi:phosphatidylserine/phosphatidylglycerophosphate/cardiolipin synthase-like enzyme
VAGVALRTLTDGGQPAEETAHALAAFIAAAQRSLEIAVYDYHLPPELQTVVAGELNAAEERGVAVRLAYNVDHPGMPAASPPPRTSPDTMDSLPFPTAAIPGVPDLMHHKYVIRDGKSLWTGSTNWTADSWTREENVIVTVDSPALAALYLTDFEQLWTTRDVSQTGRVETAPVDGFRAWFCPGRGNKLAHRIAKTIGSAQRRVRIASPVISSAPILGTLAEVASDGKVDLAGVVDATQIHEVLAQWHADGNAEWKAPLLRTTLTRAPFSGKVSTPYAPGSVHDYMHAKVTVADDRVFVGSFNLSHSGEDNAENVIELEDAQLADRLAAFVDEVRARYPAVAV